MPSLAMYELAPPTDENEFENMLMDYGRLYYKGISSSILGRRGQKQRGIDILVTREDGTHLTIQCKDYINTLVTKSRIDEWVNKAEESPIQFSFFIIATASRRNAELQEYVAVKSSERVKTGKFPITIIFWEDVEHFIKSYPELLRMYYPMFYQGLESLNNMKVTIQNEKQQEYIAIKNGEIKEEEARIQSEYVLRGKFLDAVYKYRILEMLRVDPFVGFDFALIINTDCFDIEIQELMDRAFGITASVKYRQIDSFRIAFGEFTSYLGMICQTSYDGRIAKFMNDFESPYDHYGEVDKLRNRAIKILNEVEHE